MPTQREAVHGDQSGRSRAVLTRATTSTVAAFEQLAGGLGTAFFALVVLVLVAVTALVSLVGIGLLLVPATLRLVRALADRERARVSRWGAEIIGPDLDRPGLRHVLDATRRRELGWLAVHATFGLVLGVAAVLLPLFAVRDASFPLWWRFVPREAATPSLGFWTVEDWPGAIAVGLLGLGWVAVAVGVEPSMARLQAAPARRLLAATGDIDLPLRVAQLTATRAAALDAHATELGRIERALHDGTQNRLVAVTVLIGAARRANERDPSQVNALLEQAQSAAEQALTELRSVARGILPPVLLDRGLAAALTGLAANCAVPCRVDVQPVQRCAASVEATAYFVTAESLTNIARHSGATNASVAVNAAAGRLTLQITDDGHGGADETRGSGLVGIRRRVEAHDGTFTVTSPPGGPTTVLVELPCA